MSLPWRALLGALLGSLIVFVLHPAIQPYLRDGFMRFGESPFLAKSRSLPKNVSILPDPTTPSRSAIWLTTACENMANGVAVDRDQVRLLAEISQTGASNDKSNAFWRQMEAVFQFKLGNIDAAKRAWIAASSCGNWNDYQEVTIEETLAALATESEKAHAWHCASTGGVTSAASAQAMLALNREFMKTKTETELLQASTINGTFILRFSQSHAIRAVGLLLARESLSAYLKQGNSINPNATGRFEQSIVRLKRPGLTTDSQYRTQLISSIVVGALPGALLWSLLFGLVMFAAGLAMTYWPKASIVFALPWAAPIGIAMGLAVYWITGLILPAVWSTLSYSFLAFTHDSPRSEDPIHIGLTGNGLLVLLSIVVTAFISIGLMTMSVVGQSVMPALDVRPFAGFSGQGSLGIALAAASFVPALAAAWALAKRHQPKEAAVLFLRRFGTIQIWISLALLMIACPTAILMDQKLGSELENCHFVQPN